MRAKLKAQKIIMWITLVIALITQACGWYLAVVFGGKGNYKYVGEVVPGTLLVLAAIATVASVIFAMLSRKGDTPGKGAMIGMLVSSTVAVVASLFGADIAFLIVGKLPVTVILVFCCIGLGIVNLIFSIKATNAMKRSGSQP